MMFNIENCDVTMENGYLRLIYHTDKLPVPMVLAVTKSYHDLNEKAMQLFDEDDCDEDCENCEFAELDDRNNDKSDAQPKALQDIQQYEYVDGPAHYHGTECIENMRKLFGDEAVRWFCICNAYKYRFRDGSKPGVAAEQDEEKARWYEDYAVKMMGEQRYY